MIDLVDRLDELSEEEIRASWAALSGRMTMRLIFDERVGPCCCWRSSRRWCGVAVVGHPGLDRCRRREVVHAETFRGTVADALQQLNVPVDGGDRITPAPDAPVRPGMTVAIERGVAVVIAVDGRNVGTGRRPRDGGRVSRGRRRGAGAPGPGGAPSGHPRDDDTVIRVMRVRPRSIVREATIPYETWRWAEPSVGAGPRGLLREGREGLGAAHRPGHVRRRRLVHQLVVDTADGGGAPGRDFGVGTRIVVRAMQTPAGLIRYTDVLDMEATAYYPGARVRGRVGRRLHRHRAQAGHGVTAVIHRGHSAGHHASIFPATASPSRATWAVNQREYYRSGL